jgi:hypothetical protein
MKPSTDFASLSAPGLHSMAADRAYQGLTIAAMSVRLGTLWAF